MWTFIVKIFLLCGLIYKSMSTMDYLDFHCSFRACSKEFNKIWFMSTFIAVLAVVVKNHIDFRLCQLWIIWTSIAVLGIII